ncbi:MAG: hypothetical protein JST39_01595 [Bacteroidetes bacterium]|nr:hypothetical protein [Bacteroidota bacterium]
MKTLQRITRPTPKFFQTVRNIGLVLAALSAAVYASPVVLPEIVTNIAGYVAVAGGVMTAVSQTAVKNEKK